MASNNYYCSLEQAYNFKKDEQQTVGHLVSLTIGSSAFTADHTLTNPVGYAAVTVAGTIASWSWDGGYANPIYLDCNISTTNQTATSVLTQTNLSNTVVVLAFNIYQFDPVNKVYYLACTTTSTPLNGFIFKQGGALSLAMDVQNDPTVPSPLNYRMSIGVMPQPSQQIINFAVSNSQKFSKQWGITVPG
jgi:hypothetical protein